MNELKNISDEDLKNIIRKMQDKVNDARKDYERLQLSYRLEQQGYLDEYNQRLYRKNNQQ